MQARWPIGPVCAGCYTHIRANPKRCAGCATTAPILAVDEHGHGRCGPCAGLMVDYSCAECGDRGTLYEKSRCVACVRSNRLAALLADDTGGVPARLRDLYRALTATTPGGPSLRWVTRGPGAQLLVTLTRDPARELSHALLDAAPPSPLLDSLRALLVHVGVLPERREYLDRVEPWLRRLADQQPTHIRRPLLSYGRWSALARTRAAHTGDSTITSGTAEYARRKIRAALDLLTWLDADGIELSALTQPVLDRYLHGVRSSPRRFALHLFLAWAADSGLAAALHVQTPAKSDPHVFLDPRQGSTALCRCLTDATLPTPVRVAGSLVLLFGLTVPRLTALTDNDVLSVDGETFLRLTDKPLPIPPRLAVLLTELRDHHHAQNPSQAASTPPNGILLFPGRHPRRPIHSRVLCRRLRANGIPVLAGRNNARAALAEDLPAPVLADLLGISITAANRWSQHVASTWTPYLAARAPSEYSAPE